ncbi:hypothetical protein [Companilactobacillus hulinensis]|uniref:hypothetical protein n=1 Tax=Companilactobacillus hulinensis TaxID=2486007 RepID=UPI000F774819|nr:hypothetical protein [Companilactobacillus hulinensis]
MKTKYWGILTVLTFVVIAGCGERKKSVTQATKSEDKTEIYNYQSINKPEKNKILFEFKTSEDAYNDYSVDMLIKNKSKQDAKFYLSKFMILLPDDTDFQINSNLKSTIIVKAGETKKIDHIFTHLYQTILDGNGGYYYLSKNYRLEGLKESVSMQHNSAGVSSKYRVNNPKEAIEFYKESMAFPSRSDIEASPAEGGFNIFSSSDPTFERSLITYDGSIVLS